MKTKKKKIDKKTDLKVTQNQLDKLIKYATTVPSTANLFKKEVRKNVIKAILAAFAFIIAFSWRDAIKEGVNELVLRSGVEGTGYVYQIIMTSIVTVVCVIGIMFFSRFKAKEEVKK